jgi:hypothetical protein
MAYLRIPALALAAILGSGVLAGTAGVASAMPMSQLTPVAKQISAQPQNANWACGPYRCWGWHRHYWCTWDGWGWHRHYWHPWGGWGWRRHYWHPWGGWGWHHHYWHRWGGWHHHHHYR